MKRTLSCILLCLAISSCASSGGTKNNDSLVARFVTGTAIVNAAQDVHIINMIRAIGAPNIPVAVGKYKYYQWQYSRAVGVNTLLGGGSTTLYCNLTAETQANKISLINWYGNQCGIFLDPLGDYLKDKLNIAVITDDDEGRKAVAGESNVKQVNENIPAIDLRQKTIELKSTEQQKPIEKLPDLNVATIVETKPAEKNNAIIAP